MKHCTKCREQKELSCFSKEAQNKVDGLRSICKTCDAARWKNYSESNRESLRIKDREYHKQNRENPEYIKRQLLKSAKRRSKVLGRDFNITIDDLPEQLPTTCPVLHIPLYIGNGKSHDNSPTLDRIDAKRGYIKGNIQVISHRANTLKSNATVEELKLIINHIDGQNDKPRFNSIW